MNATGTCIIIGGDGTARCLYQERIDWRSLGEITIRRASHVEPDADGRWRVDLAPVGGPGRLGPFDRRSEALAAERAWLTARLHRLTGP